MSELATRQSQPATQGAQPQSEPSPPPTLENLALQAVQVTNALGVYWRQLRKAVVVSAGLYLVFAALAGFIYLNALQKPTVEYSVQISGGATLAADGILVTVILGLQIAIRTPAPTDLESWEFFQARRRFLSYLGFGCLFAAIAVNATYAGLYFIQILGKPNVNYALFFGPIFGGALLAFLAADASLTADNKLEKAIGARYRQEQSAQLRRDWRTATRDTRRPTRTTWWLQFGLLALPPIVLFIADMVAAPTPDILKWLSRIVIIVAAAFLIYVAVYNVHLATIKRSFGDAILAVLGTLFGIAVIGTAIVFAALDQAQKRHLNPDAYIGVYLLIAVVVGFVISGYAILFCFPTYKTRQRGLLLQLSVRSLYRSVRTVVKAGERASPAVNAQPKVKSIYFTRMGFGAFAGILLPPFGVLVAVGAFRQNKQFNRELVTQEGAPNIILQRSNRLPIVAMVVSTVIAIAWVGVCVWLSIAVGA